MCVLTAPVFARHFVEDVVSPQSMSEFWTDYLKNEAVQCSILFLICDCPSQQCRNSSFSCCTYVEAQSYSVCPSFVFCALWSRA